MNDWERSLFQGIGISRISKIVPQIPDITPSPVKGSILSIMLPSLHYIAIVATLDEALMEYIEIHDIPWPSRTKRDLFNRINVVSGVVPNINAPKLQRFIRDSHEWRDDKGFMHRNHPHRQGGRV